MKIEETENADLEFNSENYNTLKKGIVIFPETLDEAKGLKTLKKYIERNYLKIMFG